MRRKPQAYGSKSKTSMSTLERTTYRIVVTTDDFRRTSELFEPLLEQFPLADAEIVPQTPDEFVRALETANGFPQPSILITKTTLPDKTDVVGLLNAHPLDSTQVIFVGNEPADHTRVYLVPHAGFVSEPIEIDNLQLALELAFRNLRRQDRQTLVVKNGSSVYAIDTGDILYMESDLRIVNIHTADEVIKTYATLSEFSAKLPDTFIQCHKSFIVNSSYIREITNSDLVLQDGTTVPISRRRRKSTIDAFNRLFPAV
ncbi:LytR/AlgR family response regulator transcription factor [Slackia heliotrinireducens]|nr:LytTR family DNA-binding domain-containing protein [Slackia heliotrinireducens]VEH00403.1 putative two-component response-regulatory protein YehT [Slackia heliotrinireducens]